MKYLLLFFSFNTFAQSTKFITLDSETLEFVSEVSYILYANKKPIFSNLTSKDRVTNLPKDIVFDSISFNKSNFKEIGFKMNNLTEVVLISKTVFELDEVVIPNTKVKETIIGEKSRFVKKRSLILSNETNYGLLFPQYDLQGKLIKSLTFFIEKVKYKTAYKIKFYAAHETGNPLTFLNLQLNDLIFESPVLNLEVGTKNEVKVDLEDYDINTQYKDIFICLELQAYYDENNNSIEPEIKDKTRLKFQLSNRTYYYSKTVDINTKEISDYMVNINSMINRDFAIQFFKKPHKSQIVAPAIILTVVKKK
jgi:hypothetical protein